MTSIEWLRALTTAALNIHPLSLMATADPQKLAA